VEPGVDDGLAGFYIDVKYSSIVKRDWIFECAGVANQSDLLILHRFGNVRGEQCVELFDTQCAGVAECYGTIGEPLNHEACGDDRLQDDGDICELAKLEIVDEQRAKRNSEDQK